MLSASDLIRLIYEFRHFLLEVVPLAIVALYLSRAKKELKGTVRDLGAKIETLKQQVTVTQDIAEEALSRPASGTQNAQNWDEIRIGWNTIKQRIEASIDAIKRRNSREKYSRFTRYRYAGIIKALERDKIFDQRASIALQQMELEFQRLRVRPAAVTSDDVERFRSLVLSVEKALAPLPEAPQLGNQSGASSPPASVSASANQLQ